jgi:hypothetical protein
MEEICNHALVKHKHRYSCPITPSLDGYDQIGDGDNAAAVDFTLKFCAISDKSSGVVLTIGGQYAVEGSNGDPFIFFFARMTREGVRLFFWGLSTIESLVSQYLDIAKQDRSLENFAAAAMQDITKNDNELFYCPSDCIDQFKRVDFNDFFKSSKLDGKYVLLIVLRCANYVEETGCDLSTAIPITFHEVMYSQSVTPTVGAASTKIVTSVQMGSEMNSASAGLPLRDHSAKARQVSIEANRLRKEQQEQESIAQKQPVHTLNNSAFESGFNKIF